MSIGRNIHLLICILSVLLGTVPTRIAGGQESADGGTSASHATPPADTLSAVGVSAQRQLEESLAELAALRQAIAEEKVPMGRRLSELEEQLLEVRREYQQTMRLLDSRTLDLSNLRSEVQSRREEKTYISNLLSEYIRSFETRLHIAEIQRYSDLIEAARLAPENSNLSETEVYQTQVALVTASLERLHEALGGVRFDGSAVDSSGRVRRGTFVLLGPVALFRSDDGETVGIAEQRLGSLEPTILPFGSEAMTQAAATLVATGAGEFPFDPTLGNAHKIEATKQTLIEHIRKGGVVMYPILGLFGAAMLVVLFKWIELARLRQPSERRIRALLEAISERKKEVAAAEAAAIGGPTGAMLATGVEHLREPPALIEEVMYEKILTARLRLQRFLPFIAISAAAAPLLGLLGTVTGIINTFKLITVFGSGDVKTLSGGISEALITTEFGLIVAIPSLLLHAFLSRKARGMIAQMEKAAIRFMNQVGKTPYQPQDAANTLAEMPAAVAEEVLRRLRRRAHVLDETCEVAPYAPGSAGSMMEPASMTIHQSMTVAEALNAMRAVGSDEDFHAVFVVDEEGRYVGDLHVRLLLTRPEQARIESLIDRDTLFVRTDTDRDEVQHLFRTHDVRVMPVLDDDDQLVGRVIRNGE